MSIYRVINRNYVISFCVSLTITTGCNLPSAKKTDDGLVSRFAAALMANPAPFTSQNSSSSSSTPLNLPGLNFKAQTISDQTDLSDLAFVSPPSTSSPPSYGVSWASLTATAVNGEVNLFDYDKTIIQMPRLVDSPSGSSILSKVAVENVSNSRVELPSDRLAFKDVYYDTLVGPDDYVGNFDAPKIKTSYAVRQGIFAYQNHKKRDLTWLLVNKLVSLDGNTSALHSGIRARAAQPQLRNGRLEICVQADYWSNSGEVRVNQSLALFGTDDNKNFYVLFHRPYSWNNKSWTTAPQNALHCPDFLQQRDNQFQSSRVGYATTSTSTKELYAIGKQNSRYYFLLIHSYEIDSQMRRNTDYSLISSADALLKSDVKIHEALTIEFSGFGSQTNYANYPFRYNPPTVKMVKSYVLNSNETYIYLDKVYGNILFKLDQGHLSMFDHFIYEPMQMNKQLFYSRGETYNIDKTITDKYGYFMRVTESAKKPAEMRVSYDDFDADFAKKFGTTPAGQNEITLDGYLYYLCPYPGVGHLNSICRSKDAKKTFEYILTPGASPKPIQLVYESEKGFKFILIRRGNPYAGRQAVLGYKPGYQCTMYDQRDYPNSPNTPLHFNCVNTSAPSPPVYPPYAKTPAGGHRFSLGRLQYLNGRLYFGTDVVSIRSYTDPMSDRKTNYGIIFSTDENFQDLKAHSPGIDQYTTGKVPYQYTVSAIPQAISSLMSAEMICSKVFNGTQLLPIIKGNYIFFVNLNAKGKLKLFVSKNDATQQVMDLNGPDYDDHVTLIAGGKNDEIFYSLIRFDQMKFNIDLYRGTCTIDKTSPPEQNQIFKVSF